MYNKDKIAVQLSDNAIEILKKRYLRGETPEEMLVRLDAQIAVQDATAELEAEETEIALAAAGEPAEIIPPDQWADPSPSGSDIVPAQNAPSLDTPRERE